MKNEKKPVFILRGSGVMKPQIYKNTGELKISFYLAMWKWGNGSKGTRFWIRELELAAKAI